MDDITSSAQPENLVVAVLIADGVTASDAINPAEALAVIPGVTVRFVGSEKGPKRTVHGPSSSWRTSRSRRSPVPT